MKRLALSSALAVLLAFLAATVVVSLRQAPQPTQVQMRNGSIWVASNQIGEATLLDGIGAEVNARVPVASNSTQLSVEQAGANAYVLDQHSGNATRIDGATLRALRPINLTGASAASTTNRTRLLVGRSTVYQLNPVDDQLAAADAHDMTRRGSLIEIPPESRGITTGNRLVWLLDPQSGDLRRYGDETKSAKRFRPVAAGAQNLVNVAGRPVLLDYRNGNASRIDPDTGEVTDTLAAELTEHDVASGSDQTQRLVIVHPRLGAVSVCRFGEGTCRAPIYLTSRTARLGAAVEIDNHLLVPDFGEGKVWIVDLATMATTGHATLFDPQRRPDRFDLLTRDGIAFFNDPDSERAGVINLDGTVRHIKKYDPAAPSSTATQNESPTGQATPSASPTAQPGRTGTSETSATDIPQTAPTGAPQTGSGPSPAVLRIIRLDFSLHLPEIGETVTASAETTGGTPQQWQWTIRRPDRTVVTSGQSPRLTHTFDATGTYEVALTVSDGTVTDTHSENLTVIPISPPLRCGDTITTSVRLHADLTCPPSTGFESGALRVGADNIVIDLDGHTLASSAAGEGVGIRHGSYNPFHECGTGDGYHDVTIRNGTVRGFATEVSMQDGQAMSLVDLRLLGEPGPRSQHGSGVYVDCSQGVTMQGGAIQGLSQPIGTIESLDLDISGAEITGPGQLTFAYTGNVTIEHSSLTNVAVSYSNEYYPNVTTHSGSLVVEHSQLAQTLVNVGVSLNSTIHDNDIRQGESGKGVSILSGASSAKVTGNRFVDSSLFLEPDDPDYYDLAEVHITENTFTGAGAAGAFIQFPSWIRVRDMMVSGNAFSDNGHQPGGLLDHNRSLVDDGLHITVAPGSDITGSDNRTSDNADYGIEAEPGTVIDGGGNISTDDPNGCLGVACA